jgi:phosphatidylinositol glycan class Q protein
VLLLHAAIETLLAFMNHFPLFALMLRVKDPWRLPGATPGRQCPDVS